MRTLARLPLLLAALALIPVPVARAVDAPPLASPAPVTDEYWGRLLVDDYRYLENQDDPQVLDWARRQDAFTRSELEAFPGREALARRIRTILRHESPSYSGFRERGGRLFAVKRQPPKQQPFVVLLTSFREEVTERVLVDPNAIDPTGGTAIDFFVPSNGGRYLAVSLSEKGTEDGTVHVWDVETGAQLDDVIPRVNGGTAGGAVAWTPQDDAFFYTRYPYPGERPEEDLPFYQQIWFHRLGTPLSEDRYILGETFPRIAEIEFATSDDGRWIVAEVSNGDGGEYEYWLRPPDGDWTRFARFEDGIQGVQFGSDGALYLRSRKDAPRRKILRLTTDAPDLAAAQVVVPEPEGVIQSFAAGTGRVWVAELLGGPIRLRIHEAGQPARSADVGEVVGVGGLTRLSGDRLLFRRESFLDPPAWYELVPGDDTPRPTAMLTTTPADFGGCETMRLFAEADDGTQIPISLVKRQDTPLDGTAPTILYGYGSYGISQTPRFRAHRIVWVEQGGVLAVAHVRGGGEYGDEWHRAANLERKKTSMDDFAACARHLVEAGITTTDRLAIEGGSAGGLLVYGTMAHYPARMAAVVAHVGIADLLRAELEPNGKFNITEFGTVTNREQFPGMLAASPYHHVREGVTYPAVLSKVGMNDPRVAAWHSFKMTARLQATGTPNPVLLRLSLDTGHGGRTALSKREAELVDVYSFLFGRLGVTYRPLKEAGTR